MIEERFVGAIETPEDRTKIRRLAPPILITVVLLGIGIDAYNGILTENGALFGVIFGTPLAASIVEYSTNVRAKRRFGVPHRDEYQDAGLLETWLNIGLVYFLMCGIAGIILLIPSIFVVVSVSSFAMAVMNTGGLGTFATEIQMILSFILSGLITATFLPGLNENYWDDASPVPIATFSGNEAAIKEGITDLLEKVGDARDRINRDLENGQHEQAATLTESTLAALETADRLNYAYNFGLGTRVANLREDIQSSVQEDIPSPEFGRIPDKHFQNAQKALAETDIDRLEVAVTALRTWTETTPDENTGNKDRISILSADARTRCEELAEEVNQITAQLEDVGADSMDDQSPITRCKDICNTIGKIQDIFNISSVDIAALEATIDEAASATNQDRQAVVDIESQREAVEQAIQSREYEKAKDRIASLRSEIAAVSTSSVSEATISEWEAIAEDLEKQLAAKKADSSVTGLMGSAMSQYSNAATLLEDGDIDDAREQLTSARDSLAEAEALSKEHELDREDSIAEKQRKVDHLLAEATERPREQLQTYLADAEQAIQTGIDARESGDLTTARETFADACDLYEKATTYATDHDLAEEWEVTQRASMATEYLEVVENELAARKRKVRDSMSETLADVTSSVDRAEQHKEVDDVGSAHDSLSSARDSLEDAAQLAATGLVTSDQQEQFATLDERVQSLTASLPDEDVATYRNRDLIETLQQLTVTIGESPRPEFVNAYGEYSADAYLEAFGSWSDALAAANLDPIDEAARQRRKYSRTEVLEALIEVINELDRVPSRTEMNNRGAVSSTTVDNRFADWETAVEFATSVHEGSQSGDNHDSTADEEENTESISADEDSSYDGDTEADNEILEQLKRDLEQLQTD